MNTSAASVLKAPPVYLAPMAGITDLPFRTLVTSFGASLVVSEMIASHEMVQATPLAREKAEPGLENTAVQIAGREAFWMARAARIAEDRGARIIDINMGCPAKRVTTGHAGSALMKDLDRALTLIDAVVGAVGIPVTLKTRLGWDDDLLNAPELAARAEACGVSQITIHGRTRCQFYRGRADWAAIRAVKEAVSIPVIANGDITDEISAARALAASGADGVMIGRGARGKPWLPAQVMAALSAANAPDVPAGHALAEMVTGHYEAMLSFYGWDLGRKNARKHLGWYMDAAATPPGLRRAVLTEPDPERVRRLIEEAMIS